MRRGARWPVGALALLAAGAASAGELRVRQQQVRIEARFVEVARDSVSGLGFDWSGDEPGAKLLGDAGLPALGALVRDEGAKDTVLATRQATTRTGSPAQIEVGDPERVAVEVRLLPKLTARGQLGIELDVQVAQPGLSRLLGTRIVVPDGETVVIGGLFTDATREAARGVPGLADVPVLGELFRKTAFKTLRNDMLILITPYVLGEDGPRPAGSGRPQAVQPRPDPGIQVPDVPRTPQTPHAPRPGYGSP